MSGRRRGRGWLLVAIVLVLIAAGAAAIVNGAVDGNGDTTGSSDNTAATAVATVQRRTLSTQQQFSGTLGYARTYMVLAQGHGTVTWLPPAGRVISQGQVLYRVNDMPVVLLYGASPTYRAMSVGAYASDVRGHDVAQLNHDLVALGYATSSEFGVAWNEFSWATHTAVEKLQKHLRVPRTGTLDLGSVVFLPGAARVTALSASLGGPANGTVLSATSTTRMVSVALDASLQSEVRAGERVTITLPNGRHTLGRVSSVGTVATVASADAGSGSGGSSAEPTVPVAVRLTDPNAGGGLDQATVEVSIVGRTVRHVLAVTVTALLALAGGGYAVEAIDNRGGHRLVPVTPGLFDDATGLVQVSGAGLAAGDRVVVPGSA